MKLPIIEHVTQSPLAFIALGTFLFAYLLVILEEFTGFRKSQALILASSIIWILIALIAHQKGIPEVAVIAIRHNFMEYAELLLFIIVAITYINVLSERNVFESIRAWLIKKAFSFHQLFWITGFLAFFLSGIADNLTTALAMSAVILAVGKGNPRFISISCINLVVAANAGGAFSPFGDITTLMVWQAGIVSLTAFFKLFLPALVNFLVPAICMHFALPKGYPSSTQESVSLSQGGKSVIVLFLLTIATTVFLQNVFNLPPALGMMAGLGYLQLFAYYTKHRTHIRTLEIFPAIKDLDWDTLLFFYGVILAVGGLATLGYLEIFSDMIYAPTNANHVASIYTHPHTIGNIFLGLLSAILDNIPLMFAVITMHPAMSEGQWLLLTLTAGVGGSLLAIGSAAGVAVMGQARGIYTFFAHLRWSWAIALGYFASIAFHIGWNYSNF